MKSYLFVLGTSFELCFSEIKQVFSQIPNTNLSSVTTSVILVECEDLKPEEYIEKLGGTIKIAEVIKTGIKEIIPEEFAPLLSEVSTFGISVYGKGFEQLSNLLYEIKKQVDHPIRFILPKDSSELSSVQISSQKVTEFIVVWDNLRSEWIIGKTIVVQDYRSWGNRDINRPHRDPRRGMLPPKVARMMVNIALSSLSSSSENPKTILDPFCGVGTVLAEALLSRANVVGSDISEQAIRQSEANVTWLKERYPETQAFDSQIQQSDAVHLSEVVAKESIDCIVTEPYLGHLLERKGDIITKGGKPVTETDMKNMVTGLEKMYFGAFKDWKTVLRPGGIIVIALPSFHLKKQQFFVKKLIDRCEKLGYTMLQSPMVYSREQAIVKRNITVFKSH